MLTHSHIHQETPNSRLFHFLVQVSPHLEEDLIQEPRHMLRLHREDHLSHLGQIPHHTHQGALHSRLGRKDRITSPVAHLALDVRPPIPHRNHITHPRCPLILETHIHIILLLHIVLQRHLTNLDLNFLSLQVVQVGIPVPHSSILHLSLHTIIPGNTILLHFFGRLQRLCLTPMLIAAHGFQEVRILHYRHVSALR